jgi:hypothetical protein
MSALGRAALAALIGWVVACGPAEEPSAEAPAEPPQAAPPAETPAPATPPAPAPQKPAVPAPSPAPGPPPPPVSEPAPDSAPAPEEPPPPAPPALSLEELGQRIKETKALGVFTKLALKNDIDALLAAIAAYHERGEGRIEVLRTRFEALVLKVTTLLEKDEPALATALARSRDDIWSRLVDPAAFAKITT